MSSNLWVGTRGLALHLEVLGGFLAIAAGNQLVGDLLTFDQGRQARALDGGDVHEGVLAPGIRSMKP